MPDRRRDIRQGYEFAASLHSRHSIRKPALLFLGIRSYWPCSFEVSVAFRRCRLAHRSSCHFGQQLRQRFAFTFRDVPQQTGNPLIVFCEEPFCCCFALRRELDQTASTVSRGRRASSEAVAFQSIEQARYGGTTHTSLIGQDMWRDAVWCCVQQKQNNKARF